jgi:hypothetical protein
MKLISKIEYVGINKVKPNENNPRVIKDGKYKALVKSIQELPDMLEMRPIIVNADYVILGGNMRWKACKEAGLKEVPIIIARWSEEQQKEFTIKDNLSFGEWDWEMIANEWDSTQLEAWGMDIWKQADDINLDDFFEEEAKEKAEAGTKITLDYTEEEYNQVVEAFAKIGGSRENIVFNLLIKATQIKAEQ